MFDDDLFQQLVHLKKRYQLKGVKAEFEAEGSSFRDVMRLRRLCTAGDVHLHLKIGGVEAIRDVMDAYEIGVDGLIAPMVESSFGAKKFREAVEGIYGANPPHLTLNLETKNSMDQLDEILEYAEGWVDNITIGRTDLSGSYFDEAVVPDCDFICDLVERTAERLEKSDITLTIGGNVSQGTVKKLKGRPKLTQAIKQVETRKVMMSTEVFLSEADVLEKALKFEELYILSKVRVTELFNKSEVNRLIQLRGRLS